MFSSDKTTVGRNQALHLTQNKKFIKDFKLSNSRLKCGVVCFFILAVLFGSQAARSEDNFSSLCFSDNVRETMCGASSTDNGDTSGMCQPSLSIVLEAHCATVVGLMTRAVGFSGASSEVEQQVKNVARISRRVVDVVVPNTQENATLYEAIDLAINESAEFLITTAVVSFTDPLSAKISPNKFSRIMFEVIDIFRGIIKNSILPSEEFKNSCRAAVANGKAFKLMANGDTCETVAQVSLDLAFNNLKAIYGLYSGDPKKIVSGILGLTDTAAGIWADNLDLLFEIGETKSSIRLREIQTLVFETASDYWVPRVKTTTYPPKYRDEFEGYCEAEVAAVYSIYAGFGSRVVDWLGFLPTDYLTYTQQACLNEFHRYRQFIDNGKYEALLIAVSRNDQDGYLELVDKWFPASDRAQYENVWGWLSTQDVLENPSTYKLLENYEKAVEAKMIVGHSTARALFGAGRPSTPRMLADIFNVVNTIDPNNGNEAAFSSCLNPLFGGLPPTYEDFSKCMVLGLGLREGGPGTGTGTIGVRVYIGNSFGGSIVSETGAFLNALKINGVNYNMQSSPLPEYEMIRLGVRLMARLEHAMTLWQSTVTSAR